MNPIKLTIVDNHKMVRDTFAYFLEQEHGMKVVIKADNGRNFLNALRKTKADIVFLDLEMPILNGKDTCKILLEKYPDIKIIAWSFHTEKEIITGMLDAGVKGFVSKDNGVHEAPKAIKAIVKGKFYVCKNMTNAKDGNRTKISINTGNSFGITARELRVLSLLNQGYSGKEIAKKLSITYRTVDSHKRHIFRKTGTNSWGKLVALARSNGLLE